MKLPRRMLGPPRRRFRNRLLAGMIVVALLPLSVFALLVAANLGGITRQTVDEAHRTISGDLRARELTAVADRSRQADRRLSEIAGAARQLRDSMSRAVMALPTAPPPGGLGTHDTALYQGTGGGSAALVLRAGAETQAAVPAAAATQLQAQMSGFRRTYSEITAVWVMQRSSAMLMTVPGFDVVTALDSRRLSVAQPQLRGGQDVFTASRQRFIVDSDASGSAWTDTPSRRTIGPFWTDVYPLAEDGTDGLTVWMPLSDGNLVVGLDISLAKLTDDLLATPVTDAGSADTLLLSSSNMVLAGSGDLHRDFGMPQQAAGLFLPPPTNKAFAAGVHSVEQTGQPGVLQASIGGTARDFIAQPIQAAHWVLATAIPLAAYQPDLAALSRGVDSSLHAIYLQALPVLLLLLGLAFLLANVMSRRLVGPVRALTAAAGRLASGRTEEAVPRQGEDEVGELADSLERMRRDINESRETILAASRELEVRVAERTRELRARNEELVVLNGLAGSLTRSLDPTEIIDEALSAVRAIVPTTDAAGFVVGDDGLIEMPAGRPHRDGVPAAARLADVAERTLAATSVVQQVEERSRLLGIPLDGGEGANGALVVRTRRRRPTEQTLRLLQSIGDQVGLALRSAELSAESHKHAVLSERARLAREIHDTLAQQLTAVVLQLEAAEGLVSRDSTRARSAVESAREMARMALREARRSVWDLRPTPLTDTGVVAAMAAEVEQWRRRTGTVATFRAEAVRPPLPLAPAAEVAMLRILQEALTNVARHSRARSVEVRVSRVEGEFRLTVTDDGDGFAADRQVRSGSFGLIGMAERARLVGGTLEVVSTPDGGTWLCATVPLGDIVSLPA